jgi:hypothetical protein
MYKNTGQNKAIIALPGFLFRPSNEAPHTLHKTSHNHFSFVYVFWKQAADQKNE